MYFEKVIDGYIFRAPSKRKQAKYDVYDYQNRYITSFGSRIHQQYIDTIGYYKHLNHYDPMRRLRYYQRHGTDAKKDTAKWFASKFLW